VLGFVALFTAMVVLLIAGLLITGKTLSMNAGQPHIAAAEMLFYAMGGWLAWWGLHTTAIHPFRKLARADVRAILIGLGALVLVRVGTAVLLILTDQTKHVQSGFENFDVSTSAPALTALGVTLTISSMVIVGPIVEEIVFRGLLFGALASRLGVLASAVITALIFGAVHGDLVLFPSIVALGIITALAYAATGNLWVAITLHALNNALGAAFIVATSLTKH
jgi:membrane protease YdiL (CAAX protease family)